MQSVTPLLELGMQLAQRVDRGRVEEPGLGIEHQPPDVLRLSASASTRWRRYSALTKKGGASVDEQAGDGLRLNRRCRDSHHVLDAAEHGVVRTRGAVEEYADRERDRDDDASEHAEDEHAAERDERKTDLGGSYVAKAPDRAEVDQPRLPRR